MSSASTAIILRVLGIACLALAWLIPNHYPPWGSFYTESCAAIALTFLFLAASIELGVQRLPRAFWLIVALAVMPWIQLLTGLLTYVGDAWVASLYLSALAIAIATGWVRDSKGISLSMPLAFACLAGGLISSVLALTQSAHMTGLGIWALDALDGMRPYANLAQPNNLATLVGFGFASLLFLFERSKISAVGALAVAVPMLLGIVVTQSRTALLYGPLCLLALWLWARRGVVLRIRLRAVAALTVAQWLITYYWPAVQSAMLMAASTSLEQREARTIRFLVWPVLVDALSTRPWFGFGWLQVGAAELSAADRHPPATELYLHSHNVLLDLAIFCGYPLAIVITALLTYWFVSRLRHARSAEAITGMLVVIMFGAHAMLELPHHYAYFLIPVGLWVGVVERDFAARTWLSARWMWAVALLALVGTGVLWADYPRLEEEFRLVRFEGARIQTQAALDEVPANPALSSLTAFLTQARREPTRGMSTVELEAMRDSVDRYPYAASLKRYAIALSLNGRPDEARFMFLQIRQIYGQKPYALYQRELRDDIAEGKVDYATLALSLPP